VNRIEELTASLRRQLGVGNPPGSDGVDRLCAWLGDRVDVEPSPVDFGFTTHWEDGTATVWAPQDNAESLLHELGHAMLTTGLARYLERQGFPTSRTQHWREEYTCDRFMRAFLLPPGLVWEHDDDELVELTGCSPETVRRRREELLEG
jgi:hypothetical protein